MIDLENIINLDLLKAYTNGIIGTIFGDDKKIKTEYIPNLGNIRSISSNGTEITFSKDDGSTGSFITQDSWRGIQDNLDSESTTDSLSANQGRILKGKIDELIESNTIKTFYKNFTLDIEGTGTQQYEPSFYEIDIQDDIQDTVFGNSIYFAHVEAVTQSNVLITTEDDDGGETTSVVEGYRHVSMADAFAYYNEYKDENNLTIRSWKPDVYVDYISTDKLIIRIEPGSGFEGGEYTFMVFAIGK